MSAVNTKRGTPNVNLYPPFESKGALLKYMREQLLGVDPSRLQDMMARLSATNSAVWHDPEATAN